MRCAPLIPEVGGCWWGGNFVPSRRNGTAAAARDGNARRAEPNKPNRLHNGGGWMLLMMTSRSYIHGRSIFSLLNSTTPRPTNCRFDALLLLLLDLCSSTLSFFFPSSSIPFILSGSFEAATNDSRWTHPSRALSSPRRRRRQGEISHTISFLFWTKKKKNSWYSHSTIQSL